MEQNFISAMINAMTEELEKVIGDKKGAMEDLRQAVSIDPSIVENINGEFKK